MSGAGDGVARAGEGRGHWQGWGPGSRWLGRWGQAARPRRRPLGRWSAYYPAVVAARRLRWRLVASLAGFGLLASGCGATIAVTPADKQRFLDSVYGQAPDISTYRTSDQLVSMAEAVCADLSSGASVQVVADRLPLVEGSVSLPPTDLGVVIYSAVRVLCPKFDRLLSQ